MKTEDQITLTRQEASRLQLIKEIKDVEAEIIELGEIISVKQSNNDFMNGIVEERKLLVAKMWMLTRYLLYGNNGFA